MTARRVLALGLAVGAVGCGGDVRSDAAPSAQVEEAFVPPRDTDILVADLSWDARGTPLVGRPTNLTQRPGYDNQPAFLPDGSGLWYTVVEEDTGQADIWRYDLGSSMVARITMSSPESEYSATPLPDGSGISVIRVEADSTQRLWRFNADGSQAAVLFQDIAPVGYHAWVDETTAVMFVLGQPATLQRGDLRTGRAETLARDIGRSIQRIPRSADVSYVQRNGDGSTTIMRLPGDGGPASEITPGIGGGQDTAWAPNGTLFMAEGSILYAVTDLAEGSWTPVADFSDLHITLSRLAVRPDGDQIAMVAEVAPIEAFPGN